MGTRTTAKRVNLGGTDMVEIHVSDRWLGSFTNVLPYQEAKDAYYNHTGLFDWNEYFTFMVLQPLFEK